MNRSIKELYVILWEYIKDKSYIGGLCMQVQYLNDYHYISKEEEIILEDHLKGQRYLHPEFQKSERNWNFKTGSSFWWKYAEDDNPVNRKAFIQKIISTLI